MDEFEYSERDYFDTSIEIDESTITNYENELIIEED